MRDELRDAAAHLAREAYAIAVDGPGASPSDLVLAMQAVYRELPNELRAFTPEDVDMMRRLFKQQMEVEKLTRDPKTVRIATRIDQLADRLEAWV